MMYWLVFHLRKAPVMFKVMFKEQADSKAEKQFKLKYG